MSAAPPPTAAQPARLPARSLGPWRERLLAGGLFVLAGALLAWAFGRLPIEGTSLGIDWGGLWQNLRPFPPAFGNLMATPWAALLLWPLGRLSFAASWGVLTLLTLAVLALSVPAGLPRWQRWLGIALACANFLALRVIADGNLELLIVAGALLTVQGLADRHPLALAAGVLLVTSKVQEAWLLVPAVGVYALLAWPPRPRLAAAGLVAAVAVPTLLWLGDDWLRAVFAIQQRGSIMDASLLSALARLGLPFWLGAAMWAGLVAATLLLAWRTRPRLDRTKAAFLIAASLLLAPYAAGNSYLTVLAVGVLPLALAGRPVFIALLVLANLPILFPPDFAYQWSAYYWTGMLALTWLACALELQRMKAVG